AANHDRIGSGAIGDILRTQDFARVGGERRQEMNANSKSGARSHAPLFARPSRVLQRRARGAGSPWAAKAISDRAAARACRTPAFARPAAGPEQPAAAAEAREPPRLPGAHERRAARHGEQAPP